MPCGCGPASRQFKTAAGAACRSQHQQRLRLKLLTGLRQITKVSLALHPPRDRPRANVTGASNVTCCPEFKGENHLANWGDATITTASRKPPKPSRDALPSVPNRVQRLLEAPVTHDVSSACPPPEMATNNVQYGFVDEAADAGGVSVKALLATPGVSDGLAARVTAADADGSGVLSLAELVSVFRSEENAVKEKRTMRRCAVPHSESLLALVTTLAGNSPRW